MNIGLVRHYPVREPFPSGWMTAGELEAWLKRYDAADVDVIPHQLGGIAWGRCLCSDQSRARVTARAIYSGSVDSTELLREVRWNTFRTGGLKLPVWMWRWMLKGAWMTGHSSQRGCRDEFHQRVARVAGMLCSQEMDTLAVSHAGMMIYLSRELRRLGFRGPRLGVPDHARVYVFSR